MPISRKCAGLRPEVFGDALPTVQHCETQLKFSAREAVVTIDTLAVTSIRDTTKA